MFDIHLVSVLVATLIMMAVASIWYAPAIFGRVWMSAVGLSEEDVQAGGKKVLLRIVLGGVIQFCILYALAQFIALAGEVESTSPLTTALWAALLVSTVLASHTLWERKPPLYLWVNAGYVFISFVGTAIIITYWPW